MSRARSLQGFEGHGEDSGLVLRAMRRDRGVVLRSSSSFLTGERKWAVEGRMRAVAGWQRGGLTGFIDGLTLGCDVGLS